MTTISFRESEIELLLTSLQNDVINLEREVKKAERKKNHDEVDMLLNRLKLRNLLIFKIQNSL